MITKIEITLDDDLAGCGFYEDDKLLVWQDMSRKDQVKAVNALARFYELFYPSIKEEEL